MNGHVVIGSALILTAGVAGAMSNHMLVVPQGTTWGLLLLATQAAFTVAAGFSFYQALPATHRVR